MKNIEQECDDLAVILRNLGCDVELGHVTGKYRINATYAGGPFSFVSKARRALEKAGIPLPKSDHI